MAWEFHNYRLNRNHEMQICAREAYFTRKKNQRERKNFSPLTLLFRELVTWETKVPPSCRFFIKRQDDKEKRSQKSAVALCVGRFCIRQLELRAYISASLPTHLPAQACPPTHLTRALGCICSVPPSHGSGTIVLLPAFSLQKPGLKKECQTEGWLGAGGSFVLY